VILFTVSAEGAGVIYVNGTPVGGSLTLNSTEPFTLSLEASPMPCHRFAGWLVNGSQLVAAPNMSLLVGGNTTVVARFERIAYRVSIASNASWGLVEVNGSRVETPAELEAPCGSRLALEALDFENETHYAVPLGWLVGRNFVNKTVLEVDVTGPLGLEALYRVYAYRVLKLYSNVNVTVVVNGSPVEVGPGRGYAVRGVEDFNLTLEAPLRLPLNETHSLALYSWSVGGSVDVLQLGSNPGRVLAVVRGPGWLRLEYEPLSRDVLALYIRMGNRATLTRLILNDPYETKLYRANVTVEGEWIVWRGPEKYGKVVYVVLPENWYRITIYMKSVHCAPCLDARIVTQNGPYFVSEGPGVVCHIPMVGTVYNANGTLTIWRRPSTYADHPINLTFTCSIPCQEQYGGNLPSKELMPGIEAWRAMFIRVSISAVESGYRIGEVWLRIEVETRGPLGGGQRPPTPLLPSPRPGQ